MADMIALPVLDRLETDRLILRRQSPHDAAVIRQLWTERDPRVPPHRRIDDDGRPTVEDIATRITTDHTESRPGLLSVERSGIGDVIGYCGLVFQDNGATGEPDLAYELLRRAQGFGFATEAGSAVVDWVIAAGYERLWASVRAWNVASRRVLEKLAFRETGQIDPDTVHGDSLLTVRNLSGRPPGAPRPSDSNP